MSSTELYQRLISISYRSGPPNKSIFTYELATVAPALFHDDGMMRKSPKSQLGRHIVQKSKDIITEDILQIHSGTATTDPNATGVVLETSDFE